MATLKKTDSKKVGKKVNSKKMVPEKAVSKKRLVKSSKHMVFAQCVVASKDRIWFIAEEKDLSRLLQVKQNKWSCKTPDWGIVSLTGFYKVPDKYEIIALGEAGELLIGKPGSFSETQINPKEVKPTNIGSLRCIKMIGSDVFAVGMKRQVYQRIKSQWIDISPTNINASKGKVVGFNAVCGQSAKSIYAVGFNGEVWFYNGQLWKQLNSPVTTILHNAVITPSGDVYVCGAQGVVLCVNSDGVAQIENNLTEASLNGITFFKNKVFTCNSNSIYMIGAKGLELVDTGISGSLTFSSLDANKDVMWSAGANHLLMTEDGVNWSQVYCDL